MGSASGSAPAPSNQAFGYCNHDLQLSAVSQVHATTYETTLRIDYCDAGPFCGALL